MCWGDDDRKRTEEQVSQLAQERGAREKEAFETAMPFEKSRMTGGVPYMKSAMDYQGGMLARAAGPRRAAILRRAAQSGLRRDDPALLRSLADFEANLARGYDESNLGLMREDELARQAAADRIMRAAGGGNVLDFYQLLAQMQSQ